MWGAKTMSHSEQVFEYIRVYTNCRRRMFYTCRWMVFFMRFDPLARGGRTDVATAASTVLYALVKCVVCVCMCLCIYCVTREFDDGIVMCATS